MLSQLALLDHASHEMSWANILAANAEWSMEGMHVNNLALLFRSVRCLLGDIHFFVSQYYE